MLGGWFCASPGSRAEDSLPCTCQATLLQSLSCPRQGQDSQLGVGKAFCSVTIQLCFKACVFCSVQVWLSAGTAVSFPILRSSQARITIEK